MKKLIFKTTCAVLASILIASQAFGVTQVFTIAAGPAWNATNFFNGPANITAISISTASGGATNLSYNLVDCPTVPNTGKGWYYLGLSNGSYAVLSSYLTNITYIQTNFGGVYTNANGTTNWVTVTNALWTYTNTYAATTNVWRSIAAGTCASNGGSATLVIPASGLPVTRGLGMTNNNCGVGLTITVTYTPSL